LAGLRFSGAGRGLIDKKSSSLARLDSIKEITKMSKCKSKCFEEHIFLSISFFFFFFFLCCGENYPSFIAPTLIGLLRDYGFPFVFGVWGKF